MIDELVLEIDSFLKSKGKNLLKGRQIQSKIHQGVSFYLNSIYLEKDLIPLIELAEEEQDALYGIEDNLLKLRQALVKLKEKNV